MKNIKVLVGLILFLFVSSFAQAQDNTEVISLYSGSKLFFDNDAGFQSHYYLSNAVTMKSIDGNMRRQFCSVPEGISPYEVIKNYEKAILDKGGTIIHLSKDAYRHVSEVSGETVYFIKEFFTEGRVAYRDLWGYMQLPSEADDYVVGKIATPAADIYISVASAQIDNITYYTLVTLVAEPMDMNNVTLNIVNEGLAKDGKVAIYDIYFDTGKSEIKEESSAALMIIADFLKGNTDKKFIIVGHTDNVGQFDSNIELSNQRANAVINELLSKHGADPAQLKPYGVGSVSPVFSNQTEEGRSRNRRVELVLQ